MYRYIGVRAFGINVRSNFILIRHFDWPYKKIIIRSDGYVEVMDVCFHLICNCNYYNYYTIYNEKYFRKVSLCVLTHLIGQNDRAVCKKHGGHGALEMHSCWRYRLAIA